MEELYKRWRPTKFSDVVGQTQAVRTLNDLGRRKAVPHTLLFHGASGCGKTTLARILRHKMRCGDADFVELNCADFRGIDMVRGLARTIQLAPLQGACRVWLIDEVHQLTTAGQDAFLKLLEDTPAHVYFMLATTDPQKLKRTIRTRCTEIRVVPLKPATMTTLVTTTADAEGVVLEEDVVAAVVQHADGSARKALVLLHQIIGIETGVDQLAAIAGADAQQQGIEIARALLDVGTRWPAMAAILRDIDEDPEGLRHMVQAYAAKVLLGRNNGRAVAMLQAFRDNFFDSHRAGLVLACWEVVEGGRAAEKPAKTNTDKKGGR